MSVKTEQASDVHVACSHAPEGLLVGKFLQATRLPLQQSREFKNAGKLV
jgi:hypothetical protein